MNFKHKNVLVCGMAKSGISAARLLLSLQANVTLQDIKKRDAVGLVAEELTKEGITLFLGENPDKIIDRFDLVVVSPGIPSYLPFFEIAKKNNIPLISEVELSYLICPAVVYAVTGTNGKTTTTALVGEIFKSYYKEVFVVGNIGEPFSQYVPKMDKNAHAVCELSSFQLENTREFKPFISAVLNIAPDHIDWHRSFENYIRAKENIFLNQDEKDFLILNHEDQYCVRMANKAKCTALFFSGKQELKEGAFVRDGYIHLTYKDIDEDIIHTGQLKMPGAHNIENALAAVLMAYLADVPRKNIESVLSEFRGVAHRLEYVRTIEGIDFYNDSKATNVDSAIKAVEAMETPVVLIGGGYDKHVEFDDLIQSFFDKVKHLVVIGETSQKIIDCAKKYNYKNVTLANTFEEAIETAYKYALPGESVLLSPACASWDMFDSYEQRGDSFKKYVLSIKGKGTG